MLGDKETVSMAPQPTSTSRRRTPMQTQSTALTTSWRRAVWIALLVVASAAYSLAIACATPFAAFAAIAALTVPRRDALLLIGLVWFANQAVGFGMLHYPWTAD